ncbi:hypothetical protein SAMN05216350_10572 [Polaromonas sp. YR568]|uniref:hypothetical protein n=1 Tax=Polaromonas sp. YR568 TaxID=1855301 RepID=UPI0008EE9222|nr:hypothetical protein [Polaromonas sp. YR568]SFU78294.1 hypothetical protein SAMN05216350_10572 [Polaromonas sp. YR568]
MIHALSGTLSRTLAGLLAAVFCSAGHATLPLLDRVEYQGQTTIVGPQDKPWLAIPRSDAVQAIRREDNCSAIGAPRAIWRISDGRLWLTGLFGCGGSISLKSVYGGSGEPMLAEWISEPLVTYRGEHLCPSEMGGPGIHETTLIFHVDKGVVTKISETDNTNHPAIPDLAYIEKFLRDNRLDVKEAKSLLGRLPCRRIEASKP